MVRDIMVSSRRDGNLCAHVHCVSRRRVAKGFLSGHGIDSHFWRTLCMDRFGVFDHDGLFAAAEGRSFHWLTGGRWAVTPRCRAPPERRR